MNLLNALKSKLVMYGGTLGNFSNAPMKDKRALTGPLYIVMLPSRATGDSTNQGHISEFNAGLTIANLSKKQIEKIRDKYFSHHENRVLLGDAYAEKLRQKVIHPIYVKQNVHVLACDTLVRKGLSIYELHRPDRLLMTFAKLNKLYPQDVRKQITLIFPYLTALEDYSSFPQVIAMIAASKWHKIICTTDDTENYLPVTRV